MGTKFSGSNAAPGIPLQKKALQKISLDVCLKSWSCDRRNVDSIEENKPNPYKSHLAWDHVDLYLFEINFSHLKSITK